MESHANQIWSVENEQIKGTKEMQAFCVVNPHQIMFILYTYLYCTWSVADSQRASSPDMSLPASIKSVQTEELMPADACLYTLQTGVFIEGTSIEVEGEPQGLL